MARLAILISSDDISIAEYNDQVMNRGSEHDSIQAVINLLKKSLAGCGPEVTIEMTSRDNDVSISTSGTGSDQETVDI